MPIQIDACARFRALHDSSMPLLLANPWDQGSARLFAASGFAALATTSGGFAATLGRRDGFATLDETMSHAAGIVDAVDVPVTADLEDGFFDAPADVGGTVARAIANGLAGCSVEDFRRRGEEIIYDIAQASERIRAAADVCRESGTAFMLTARAENYLHGKFDLKDTIARLQAYQSCGADVLYAPGMTKLQDIRTVVAEVDLPVNVLLVEDGPTVAELAAVGVRRVSVGSAFAFTALAAGVEAARALLAGEPLRMAGVDREFRQLARTAFQSLSR